MEPNVGNSIKTPNENEKSENLSTNNQKRLSNLQENGQSGSLVRNDIKNKTTKINRKSEDSMKKDSKWIEGRVEGIGSNRLLISTDESELRLQIFMTLITVLLLAISTILMIKTFGTIFNITEPIVLQPLGMYHWGVSVFS